MGFYSKQASDIILKKRDDKSISQAQLAQAIGASSQAVSDWERGVSLPPKKYVYLLCKALGLNFDFYVEAYVQAETERIKKTLIHFKNIQND